MTRVGSNGVGSNGVGGNGRWNTGLKMCGLALLAAVAGCDRQSLTMAAMQPGPSYVAGPGGKATDALIGPGLKLQMPRPADFGRAVEVAQLLTARYDGQSYSFEGRLSITPERLVLVGTDGIGRRAMTVTWDGHDMKVDRATWLPEAVRPGSMLADIIVLYWPERAVRRALAPAGCVLRAAAKSRRVRCGTTDVLRAKYEIPVDGKWTGSVQYSNLSWGYEIDVQSQEVAP